MTSSKYNDISGSMKSIDDNERKIYSKNDLNNHLNDIKNVLRDKERDLSLAAEIGQQLLEANTALKKAYEELYIQNQDAQRQLHRYEHMTVVHSGRSSPVQSNSSPLSPRYNAMRTRNNSPTPRARRGSRNLNLPPSVRLDGTGNTSPSSSLARSSEGSESESEEINNPMKEQFLERIKYLENSINSLERHNEELKVLLEKKKNEVKDIQIQNSKLLLIKDGEVYDLKQELESLMNKTRRLEMEKRSLTKENQRQANELDRIEAIDQEYIQDLLTKINLLDSSLKRMESTKEELEKNIENVMMEKIEYQDKCKTLDKKLEDYLYYKHLHDSQAQHIQELNQTIEQQRMQIQNLDFQLYNLAVTSDTDKPEIKFSEKYMLENPESVENLQRSSSSPAIRPVSSAPINDIDGYDPDTIVITAKRNVSSNNSHSSSFRSIHSSQETHDPLQYISTQDLGKKTLYSELENTGWYDGTNAIKGENPVLGGRLIQSSSDTELNKYNSISSVNEKASTSHSIHALPPSRTRQSYHQYHSSYSVGSRRFSDSSVDEALTLIDKANQSFGNNNIEKIIKPKIKNDVNSYEFLINTIENEFKNSEEEIKTEDNKDQAKKSKLIDTKGKKEKPNKVHDRDMDTSLSTSDDSTKISFSSKNNTPNDTMIDDTNNETTDQSTRQQNHRQPSTRPKSIFPSISNPKTLALVKHSNIPLFDYKKLSSMIENDQNLNPSPAHSKVPVMKSAKELSQKAHHPVFQHMSFESIFKAFQFSKFKSTHLITDVNYNNNNGNNKKNNKKTTSTFSLPGFSTTIFSTDSESSKDDNNNGMSILESVVRLSSPPPSGAVIQEITDNDVEVLNNSGAQTISSVSASVKEDQPGTVSTTTPFFMPKPSRLTNSIIPVGTASNREFNNLIKNFHISSPITPLIANISLNNAFRGETSSNKAKKTSAKPEPADDHESQKSMFSLKHKSFFGGSKKNQTPKMDDTPTSENTQQTNNYPGGELYNMIKDKQNQNGDVDISNEDVEEVSNHFNGIFTNTVNGSSILSSNVIMNNQVMLDQYRNTLNHYSNSGSAILQVLVDSWLRFLNGFVGYGSDINYDINNMEMNGQGGLGGSARFYPGSSQSGFSDDTFSTPDPTESAGPSPTATPSTSTSQLTKKF